MEYKDHKIGNKYTMDGEPDLWEIVYYPLLFTWDNKYDIEGEIIKERRIDFEEPRALVQNMNKLGFWHKEIPLRYLTNTDK